MLRRTINSTSTTMRVYAFGLEEHKYGSAGANLSNTYYYTLGGRLLGALDSSGTTLYITDALGSVLSSFSTAAGSAVIQGKQVFGPYGDRKDAQGTINTAKGFTGQYNESSTGLDYYNARYYDPKVGVFLSADSKQGNLQGMNPYGYVGGNPETYNDPTGEYFTDGNGDTYHPGAPFWTASNGQRYAFSKTDKHGNPVPYHPSSAGPSNPCAGGILCCEDTDASGNPFTNQGRASYLRGSGASHSDQITGVGFIGLTTIIEKMMMVLQHILLTPLAALLDPNHAAQLGGILAAVSGVAALLTGLGEGLAAALLSAVFGTASGAAAADSGSTSGISSAKEQQIGQWFNLHIIDPLQAFRASVSPSVLNKMVFTMTEVDTYAKTIPVYSYYPLMRSNSRYISGYQTDYSQIASAQFEISFYTL